MAEDDEGRGVARALLRFALAVVAIAVLGLLAGILFGRGTPRRAASSVIADLVDTVPTPAPGEPDRADLACGMVLFRYRSADVDAEGRAVLDEVATDHAGWVLVRAVPDLATPVEAAAWRHRMPLGGVNRELLTAFATAYEGQRTGAEGCPTPSAD